MDGSISVVLADDNVDFCKLVAKRMELEPKLKLQAVAFNGEEAVEAVVKGKPDVLVLDLIMPELDGLGVLEQIKQEELAIIVLTAFGQEGLIQQASNLGASYYMMKPVDIDVLIRRIKQMGVEDAPSRLRRERQGLLVEEEVTRLLNQLGMPSHYKGFRYLTTAISMVVADRDLLGGVTTRLYPAVAERYSTTGDKVERAIRHAIETTWTRGDLEVLHKTFGYSVDAKKGKPTNSSFIAKLADMIRLSLKTG